LIGLVVVSLFLFPFAIMATWNSLIRMEQFWICGLPFACFWLQLGFLQVHCQDRMLGGAFCGVEVFLIGVCCG
jgi:hypothetical protein